MKYKALLLKYIILKDTILYEKTGIHCFVIEDIDEILCYWLKKDCKYALNSMNNYIDLLVLTKTRDDNYDSSFCPWCISMDALFCNKDVQIFDGCKMCGYGKRHGKCDRESLNNYTKIRRICISTFSEIPEIQNLIKDTVADYRRIKEN